LGPYPKLVIKNNIILKLICKGLTKNFLNIILSKEISYIIYNIRNAWVVSEIGILKKLVYHRVVNIDFPPKNEFITIKGPIELSSL
jgi:hypothetical protein